MSTSLNLGGHVDNALNSHRQEHNEKVEEEHKKRQEGREKRKEKAEDLGNKFVQALSGSDKWSSDETFTSFTPNELDDGTVMVTHLDPMGTFEEAVKSVCSPKYVNEGPAVYQFGKKVLTQGEIDGNDLKHGVSVSVSLHSHDEELNIETEHKVHVGDLIDPDSILVPEHDDDGEKRFKVIGKEDDRFSSIMELVSEFFESDANKISKEFGT